MDTKVCKEQAEQDFERFRSHYRIRLDRVVDENERDDRANAKEVVLDAIMEGSVVIDDKCRPVFTSREGEEFTFDDPGAAGIAATDKKKASARVAQLCTMLAASTGKSERWFANFKSTGDFNLCSAILILFLAQ